MNEKNEEKDVIEIIKKMGEFMRNTNEMIASLRLRTDNLQVDLDKVKKELKKENRIEHLLS